MTGQKYGDKKQHTNTFFATYSKNQSQLYTQLTDSKCFIKFFIAIYYVICNGIIIIIILPSKPFRSVS